MCCRMEEYWAANEIERATLSHLNGAVLLEPLDDGQIEQYLKNVGQEELWQAIQTSPEMRSMLEPDDEGRPGILRVPLLLAIAAVAYEGKPFESRAELYEAYIDKQLSRETRQAERNRRELKTRNWAYQRLDEEPDWRITRRYLHWVAYVLKDNHSPNFVIEEMQPHDIKTKREKWIYWLISYGLLSITVGILISINIVCLPSIDSALLITSLRNVNLSGGLSAFFVLILISLLGGLILITGSKADTLLLFQYVLCKTFHVFSGKTYSDERLPILEEISLSTKVHIRLPSISSMQEAFLSSYFVSLLADESLLFTVLAFPIMALHEIMIEIAKILKAERLSQVLENTIYQLKTDLRDTRNQYEEASSRFKEVFRHEHKLVLMVIGAYYANLLKTKGDKKLRLIVKLFLVPLRILLFVLFLCFSEIPHLFFISSIKDQTRANEGLKGTFIISMFNITILIFILYGFNTKLVPVNLLSMFVLLALNLSALFDFLQLVMHFSLRCTLCIYSRSLPWNLARFLDYCVERRLLQRVGGRYRFLHRELLEYFANYPQRAEVKR